LRNYAIFHGLVAIVSLTSAVLRLRATAIRQTHGTTHKTPRRRRLFPRPGIGLYPMVWKELFVESGVRTNIVGRVILVLLVVGSFVPVGLIILSHRFDSWSLMGGTQVWEQATEEINMWIRVLGTMVACLMLLAVAARASSSISGERDRMTLDSLLTAPLTSNAILLGKWVGNIASLRWGWLWLGAIYGFGLLTGALHPLAFVVLVAAWFIYAAVLSGMGVWFSLVCRTTLRATVWTLLSAAAAGAGHLFLLMCCSPLFVGPASGFEFLAKMQVGMTPPIALGYAFAFSTREFRHPPGSDDIFAYASVGLVIWAIVAVILWALTRARFRMMFGRAPLTRHRLPPAPQRVKARDEDELQPDPHT